MMEAIARVKNRLEKVTGLSAERKGEFFEVYELRRHPPSGSLLPNGRPDILLQ
jgi:hypothetical protein